MNCQAVQNQILGLPDPRELPSALREHVVACAECQTWARQAARLESLLAQLPVPPAPEMKKESLIGDLMQAEPLIQPMTTLATRPSHGLVAMRFLRQNAVYVGGLAAAVLLAFGLYSFWPGTGPVVAHTTPTQKHPLLQKIVAGNTALARAETPTKRLEEFSKLADTVSTETRGMARIATGAELKEMAGWYDSYVKDGMVRQAKDLPRYMTEAEKTKLLDSYAAKLDADAAATEKLLGEVPPDAQPALKRMAETAREGQKSLRSK